MYGCLSVRLAESLLVDNSDGALGRKSSGSQLRNMNFDSDPYITPLSTDFLPLSTEVWCHPCIHP